MPEPPTVTDLLDSGQRALTRGDWQRAHDLFAAALARDDRDALPAALEGLGAAAWFLDDATGSLAACERAYRIYRDRADDRGAGRVACEIALDHYLHSGDPAAVRGWLRRSRRLLAGHEDTAEYAWLRHWEADVALLVERDARTARQAAGEASALARAVGDGDLEMLALALEGLAMVSLGDVADGMRLLDESSAAAVGGEIQSVDTRLTACCYLIVACDRARDYGRAARWCDYVGEAARRHDHRFSLAVCRGHYAGLLAASGDWDAADRELTRAIARLEGFKPPWAAEAVCRLAELRRRQGRVAEAAALLDRADRAPLRMLAGPDVLLVRAALALDEGATGRATGLAERYLRRIPAEDRSERVVALELLVRAYAAADRHPDAQRALDELAGIAAHLGSRAVDGWTAMARAAVAMAGADLDGARCSLEDAVDHFGAEGMPYELATARLALARVLGRLGHTGDARREATLAATAYRALGAMPGVALAEGLLAAPPPPAPAAGSVLTGREREVLALLAAGRSNEAIAEQLVLSLRTVERHVSNIYLKIGVSGRVARAGAAAYAYRHGLT